MNSEDLKSETQKHFFKKIILEREPFIFSFKEFCKAKLQKFFKCLKTKSAIKVRLGMFLEARKKLRKEFDIIELVKHVRKLNLIKLCVLSQYQRRALKYSKKSLIKPPEFNRKKTVRIIDEE